MRPKNVLNRLDKIGKQHRNLHLSSVNIDLPKSKKTDPFSHFSESKSKKQSSPHKSTVEQQQLVKYKEQYRLPLFKSRNNYHSIDVKDYQGRRRTLQSRPQGYKIINNVRSKSIAAGSFKDSIDNFIQRQLRSIDTQQIAEKSLISNHLDQKYLTIFQREQISNYKDIYYLGHKAHLRKYQSNFRDNKNNYKALIGDHIAYRFEVLKILGEGAFGKVLQVLDHKNHKRYALKITKFSEQLHHQFLLEIKILRKAKACRSQNKNIVDIKGDFEFRGHLCMVTQILSMNLYNFIKAQNFVGLDVDIVRKVMIQILQSLLFLHYRAIIHCDIKPENVCFRQLGKSGVKLIDFGSACFYAEKEFTYIQSRYYRSPQIVLVKPYDHKIDMWSLGCMAYQLYSGTPLFPSRSEGEQMVMLTDTLGIPSAQFLQKCERADQFRFQLGPNFRSIRSKLKDSGEQNLIGFIESLVRWSPQERLQAKDALLHQFILQGLPPTVKNQHLKQMNSGNPYQLYE